MIERRLLQCGTKMVAPLLSRGLAALRVTCQRQLLCNTQRVRLAAPVCGFHRSSLRLNEHIINIQDEEDFKTRVAGSSTPVIVDFYATWCGPCKLLGPKLEAVVSKGAGKVIMAKVDIDENTDLAMEYGVEAVPTVIGMRDGKVVDKFVGVKMEDELDIFVNKLTGN